MPVKFLQLFESETRFLYHLTDDKDFQLDPDFYPQNNTTIGGDWTEPGIFLAKNPEFWLNAHGYWRPWIAEFKVPSALGADYGQEVFISSKDFDSIQLTRVMALDAWCREEFGAPGWSEEYFGKTFDTGEPYDITSNNLFPYRGYKAKDVRKHPEDWHSDYPSRIEKFRINRYT